jgi:hypothetical protein
LTELKDKLTQAFNELKQEVEKIKSFFRHPEVNFYKS